jgi:hypothetical protein
MSDKDSVIELRAIIDITDPVTGEPANGWVLEVDLKVKSMEYMSEAQRAAMLLDYEDQLRRDILSIKFETRRPKHEPPHLRILPGVPDEESEDDEGEEA